MSIFDDCSKYNNHYLDFFNNDILKYCVLFLLSLGIIINIIYILNYYKNKVENSSSIEKILIYLSYIELFISIIWILNFIFIKYEKFESKIQNEYCKLCNNLSIFSIFFYFLYWLLIIFLLNHLKGILLNPFKNVLNSDKILKIYFLLLIFLSLLITIIYVFAFKIHNLSPIYICFINVKNQNIYNLIIILLFPAIIMIIGFFYLLQLFLIDFKSIKNNSLDESSKNIFKIILYYILFIFICFELFFLLLIIDKIFDGIIIDFLSAITMCLFIILNFFTPISKFLIKQNFYSKISNFTFTQIDDDLLKISFINNKDTIKNTVVISHENLETDLYENKINQLESNSISNFVSLVFLTVSHSLFYCDDKYKKIKYKNIEDKIFSKNENIYLNKTNTSNLNQSDMIKYIENESDSNIDISNIPGISNANLSENKIKYINEINISYVLYSPLVFYFLRKIDNLSFENIIFSILPENNTNSIKKTQGRSGNFFILTDDKQYILKTINNLEMEFITTKFLKNYYYYLNDNNQQNNNSILSRIYGLYKINFTGSISMNLILMKNIYCNFHINNILKKYDLKGSSKNRETLIVNKDDYKDKVLKDINFVGIEKFLYIDKDHIQELRNIVKRDSEFLESLNVMDYSLLVIKIKVNKKEYDFLVNNNLINNNLNNELINDNSISNKDNDNNQNYKNNNININKNVNYNNDINVEKNTKNNNDNNDINNIEKDKNVLDEIQMNISKLNINCIKKYLFKSIFNDIIYIIGIIDFFQVYDMKKKIEAKLKRVNSNKFSISCINSKDYKIRFINNFENITNYDLLNENFENIEENE
jgi:hypothetical protein